MLVRGRLRYSALCGRGLKKAVSSFKILMSSVHPAIPTLKPSLKINPGAEKVDNSGVPDSYS